MKNRSNIKKSQNIKTMIVVRLDFAPNDVCKEGTAKGRQRLSLDTEEDVV